jgi:hypothetical protein
MKSRAARLSRTKTAIATKRALVTIFFTGMKLQALEIMPREKKSNQNYLRVVLISEPSKGIMKTRGTAGTKLLLVFRDVPICHMRTKVMSSWNEAQRGEFVILFIPWNSHLMTSAPSRMRKSK